jgi:hypothetical protein
VLGRRFGDVSDMARSLTTSLLAVGMLVGPAAAWWCGPAVLSVWAIAILHASLSKARYCGLAALADEDWPPGAVARAWRRWCR